MLGYAAFGLLDYKDLSFEQRAFRVAYMPEDIGSKFRRKWRLSSGSIYLVKKETPHSAFLVFVDQVTNGLNGLCISRLHPEKIKKRYKFETTPILWLNDSHRDVQDSIRPNPEQIFAVIEEFILRGGSSAVLLDGIEYLTQRNGFEMTLHFIARLRDRLSQSESRIIVSLSPKAFKKMEINLLEKEAEVLTI
ncbi:MAG: DUF835 domain-containing protein [Candidatus Altiarchaeota archaeon]